MTAPDQITHQGGNGLVPRPPSTASSAVGDPVRTMLEARSVALVGASARTGSFGSRMLDEVSKSSARPRIYPVNPRYAELAGARCYPSLADLPEEPELALLAVPDAALEQQLSLAAETGCRSAVIFGNAHEDQDPAASGRPAIDDGSQAAVAAARASRPTLRERLAAIAREAGMALCGAGCMGFANISHGLRALGYTEPDPLPAGPVALVTHSGSVFSAMLRARRGFGFTLAVSSGQELVTAAPAYLGYALTHPDTRVLGLVLETIRDGAALREVLGRAAEKDIAVVLLTAGSSERGRAMVAAHSGALAGSDGGWEALARAYGVHRVSDLAEFTDALELFTSGRRVPARRSGAAAARAGIATVHDSGLERAHVVDIADSLGVPFAEIGQATRNRLASLLDPGLVPANPLDVWGTGADTRDLFGACMLALADDPAVEAVALAVDLAHEYDGDDSYPLALSDVAARTAKPLAVLSNLSSAIDSDIACQLRSRGISVLEGTRSGLLALRHLLDQARPRGAGADLLGSQARQLGAQGARSRQARAAALLMSGQATGDALLSVIADYGIAVARSHPAGDLAAALAAAAEIGYPVVLKTDEPRIQHKSDVGGVLLGIRDPAELAAGYADLATRLGPRALVCQTVQPGVELALGIIRDAELGPLVVVGAGGVLVELLADRAVALPPVTEAQAADLVRGLRIARLLAGVRGAQPADLAAVTKAISGLSSLAIELGDQLEALDVNPLICGPVGAVAVDALAVIRPAA